MVGLPGASRFGTDPLHLRLEMAFRHCGRSRDIWRFLAGPVCNKAARSLDCQHVAGDRAALRLAFVGDLAAGTTRCLGLERSRRRVPWRSFARIQRLNPVRGVVDLTSNSETDLILRFNLPTAPNS
jgi:hypothetical protein